MPISHITESHSLNDNTALAIVLAGVPEEWQKNVLQIRGRLTSAPVKLDGHGTLVATAVVLSPDQARHLATQIIEILGPEDSGLV